MKRMGGFSFLFEFLTPTAGMHASPYLMPVYLDGTSTLKVFKLRLLGIKLHFISCPNWDGFCKSSYIYVCMYVLCM